MTAASLHFLLSWLSKRFDFLHPSDLLYSEKPGVLLTFDDGFANNHDVALPILEEFEAPAIFFVSTRHVQNPHDWLPSEHERISRSGLVSEDLSGEVRTGVFNGMSAKQLRACADHSLITVGSHTVDHPRLSALRDGDLSFQLEASKQLLEKIVGSSVDLLAYPFGDYDARVAAAAKSCGYVAAFAERSRSVSDLRFEIPRVGIYSASAPYLAAKFSGVYHRVLKGPIAS